MSIQEKVEVSTLRITMIAEELRTLAKHFRALGLNEPGSVLSDAYYALNAEVLEINRIMTEYAQARLDESRAQVDGILKALVDKTGEEQ